jgi:hypothetical protein
MKQVRVECRAGGLKGNSFGDIRKRKNRDTLALIKACERRIDHVTRVHHDLLRQPVDVDIVVGVTFLSMLPTVGALGAPSILILPLQREDYNEKYALFLTLP